MRWKSFSLMFSPNEDPRKPSETMDTYLSKMGNNLVTKFHVLMRISQIYDSKNVALKQFTQESLQAINAMIQKEGALSLKVVKNDLYLNDQRLRYSVEGFTSFKYLITQWRKRLIGEVIFKGVVHEEILKEFIYLLMNLEEGGEENATLFNDELAKRDIFMIEVSPLEILEGEEEGRPSGERTSGRSPRKSSLRRSERSKRSSPISRGSSTPM